MSPSLLSDAALVTLHRPAAPAGAELRTDAMLLTHGRAGTAPLIGAALLIDAVRSGHLDVLEGRRVVAGRTSADEPRLLADLRARVLAAAPARPSAGSSARARTRRTAIATELVGAGIAMPLSPRFQRTFTLSVNARAEAAARTHIAADPGPGRPPVLRRPAHRRPAVPRRRSGCRPRSARSSPRSARRCRWRLRPSGRRPSPRRPGRTRRPTRRRGSPRASTPPRGRAS